MAETFVVAGRGPAGGRRWGPSSMQRRNEARYLYLC